MHVTAIGRALPGAAPIRATSSVRKVVRAQVPETEEAAVEALPESGERPQKRKRPNFAPARGAAGRSAPATLAALDALKLGG